MNHIDPVVSPKWLLARMYEPDLVIVDCRFALGSPEEGKHSYLASHIPGAVFLDVEQDLSAPVGPHGGRHPLPDPQELAARLGRTGIGHDTRVVAYDDQGGLYAARLWWMLRWLGHDQAYVMDGGFAAWQAGGFPVTDAQRTLVPAAFVPNVRSGMLADVNEVRRTLGDPGVLLVDSRDASRYAGEQEPIDAKAGHIPGAVNRFWKGVLDDQGAWLAEPALRERLAPVIRALDDGREAIVYCGSGVSACPNVLALHRLGYPQAKLYAGSWSDWISYSENPIATGEE
ncbi:thiosulfate/3-mercaptopyruvate sulfurtransferase [Fontibacillus phaseoli]|uniref:Thiosulfate/3-mercaptopyruvate sulfurtransferase n=1 Tax=Fontibacillus phaseoli TaxID=1416533 RepID=A0A369B0Y9_9BACL|nr:sulfurtransferase [Fontibacillus phaseoli]RCX15360.1 thiosulfate/3-mercaptopyruvate sulfurtransferase [Fontibacillus phaseoli]